MNEYEVLDIALSYLNEETEDVLKRADLTEIKNIIND